MLTTEDDELAEKIRLLSLHGISRDAWKRYAQEGSQHWETLYPGYNYHMFDIQAALGLHQLDQLEGWWRIRAAYVRMYRDGLRHILQVVPLRQEVPEGRHGHHLFVVLARTEALRIGRDAIMEALKAERIGTGVHFRSLHRHPYYRNALGLKPTDCPVAEWASDRALSLPLCPSMTKEDVADVIRALTSVLISFRT